jgi:cytochrome b6-f complex iron-sulfur subunit
MADKDSMSVEEILAACRRLDGGDASAAASPPPAKKPVEPPPAAPVAAAAETPSEAPPTAPASAAPTAGKAAKEMSVAEILAAARAQKSAAADQPSTAEQSGNGEPAAAPAQPAAPAKKPGEMSVADILAAARGQKAAPPAAKPAAPAAPKPAAPEAKAKPAAPTAKESPKKPAAGPQTVAALDTGSILAAARKSDKRGPITKEEAKAKTAVLEKPAAKPAKAKLVVPPMPEKPAYARRPEPQPVATAEPTRRGFIATSLAVFFGSALAIGFSTFTLTNLLWLLGLARFMFPNILTEPPTKFKVGFPDDYAPGQVETKYIPQFGVWIVRYQYEGQPQIYALRSVCTHLGCTPNWLDAEQKFKCPCHGSGFYKDGINFEGPAPRPLERYAIHLADDGQLEVDKSQTFNEELGAWSNPASFVPV